VTLQSYRHRYGNTPRIRRWNAATGRRRDIDQRRIGIRPRSLPPHQAGDTICERQNQGITVISELGIYRARPKGFQDAYAAIRNDKLKTGHPGPKRDEAGP
jgi:hypothetical protein